MSEIIVPEWSTACPDWGERILKGESLITFPPLFPSEAKAALDVFNDLVMVDAGGYTFGELSRPWVEDFVSSIFGAYNAETGRRLIQEFFLLISKKNAKSTNAAGIMLTALIRNWRQSGEFLIMAPTIEIANNSFYPARDAIRADEELGNLLKIQEHYRTITHRTTGATLKVVAADSDTVGGKKAIGVLVDELWLFGKNPRAQDMLREATGGLASRPEGFTIFLSTQSNEPPAGVFKEKLDYARAVRDGVVVDPKFLPVLYEHTKDMLKKELHKKKEYFYLTNPNLGTSVDVEFLEREYDKAVIGGEESMRGYLAKHQNVQIGVALMNENWIGAEFWEHDATGNSNICEVYRDFKKFLEDSEVVVTGVDGGGLDDLLGFAAIGRHKETRKWLLYTHAWVHEIALKRRPEIVTKLRDFEKSGNITIVSRPGQDVEEVADRICEIKAEGLLPEKMAVGVDSSGIGDIVDELVKETRGITMDQIIGIQQGWRLTGAIKTTERKLAGGELIHGGTDLMAWVVGNAKGEQKGNAVVITKQLSGAGKIDPLMATFNAVTLMAQNPAALRKKFQFFVIGS